MDNSEKIYKVLFKGVILPGFDEKQVIKNIHILTKIPIKTISRKFFSGKTVVIRRANDEEYAQQLQSTFTDAGIQTTIEEIVNDNSSSATEDTVYDDFDNYVKPTNKNLIVKSFIVVIASIVITITIFFFSSENGVSTQPKTVSSKTNLEMQKETSSSKPATNNAVPVLETKQDSSPLIEKVDDKIQLSHEDSTPPHQTNELSEKVNTSQESEASINNIEDSIPLIPVDKEASESILSKNLTLDPSPEVIAPKPAKTYNNINGFSYGSPTFNITLDKIASLLIEENSDYKDHFDRKTIKLLSPENKLEKIDSIDGIELYQISDLYIVTQVEQVLSITLEIDFLFSDSPYIHGSYSLRVLPAIKRKFPFFLSKFITNFNDKDKSWWDKNIEPLKKNNQLESIKIIAGEQTILIKYMPKVSPYNNFSLSDYANKALFNDRLSVTIFKE